MCVRCPVGRLFCNDLCDLLLPPAIPPDRTHPAPPPAPQALLEDPVVAADGHTYERQAIEAWMASQQQGHLTSPMTNEPLGDALLYPNHCLLAAMRAVLGG